jgi:HSP90 family molecular chaperone
MLIKAGIDASGYRTAVRDYTEFTVLEELAANSYDADAATCVVLLDTAKGLLHIIDDGIGFTQDAIQRLAILGGGLKQNIPFSAGQRHYLGSYGYGLKSSLNIADKVIIDTVSDEGRHRGEIDWTQLDHALQPGSSGYDFQHTKTVLAEKTGTHLCLKLRNPASRDQLIKFSNVLSNLPNDGASFSVMWGCTPLKQIRRYLKTLEI